MAEDEIRKHTKAVINVAKEPGKSWVHKLKEILIEIAIIVFAVYISIWLHNWSDSLKDREEEKEFLEGLKSDLQVDTLNLSNSEKFYEEELAGINYFLTVAHGISLSEDSLTKYNFIFSASTNLEANTSRYVGFKESAKFDIIQNKDLLNKIIELHEVIFTHVEVLNGIFNNYNATKTEPYAFQHLKLDKDFRIINATEVINSSEMEFYLMLLHSLISTGIIPTHKAAITKCNAVIKEIEDELK